MIPVILLAFAYWAAAGAVTSVKTARAGRRDRAAGSAVPGSPQSDRKSRAGTELPPNVPAASKKRPRNAADTTFSNPGDVTFGQWQAAMFRRWRLRVRSHLPGRHRGRGVRDLVADVTAAGLAGAAIFGMGFLSGSVWAGTKWSDRTARENVEREFGKRERGSDPRPDPGGDHFQGDDPIGPWPTDFNGSSGSDYDDVIHPDDWQDETDRIFNSPPYTDNGAVDGELLDDTTTAVPGPSQYAGSEYADLVGQPELLAHNPTPPTGDTMAEILNIHRLFEYSKAVIVTASNDAEQDAIRANSAGERAEQAGSRSITAGNRAESAGLIAAEATSQATQLEETSARFGSLNVDSASLASINAAIESANAVATAQRRRAEAEAHVASLHAALAAAEDAAAAAAAESARVTMGHVEQVKNMHDTVQTHQMPHAEAQAATGNAAAHASVLAAG
jgi:hypothetical protein